MTTETKITGKKTRVVLKLETQAVVDAIKKGAFKSIKHAAGSIRKGAKDSMVKAKGASAPGTPPNRHRSRLYGSILFDADERKLEAVIGPSYDKMSSRGYPPWMASMHERGGVFGGDLTSEGKSAHKKKRKQDRRTRTYPARPFMAPALERAKPRLAAFFANIT